MEEVDSSSDDENNINLYCCRIEIDDRPSSSSTVQVFPKEAITTARRKDVEKVMDALSLNELESRALLTHAGWNIEKLFDEIVNKDIDQVKFEAGVTEMENYVLVSSAELVTVICRICSTKVSTDVVTEMDCAHFFCNNCWIKYFISKIEEGQSEGITGIICMDSKCDTLCDELKIKHLLGSRDPELAAKFESLLLEENQNVKWCPRHCEKAISLESDEFSEVQCPCGQHFCFNCLSEGHTPCLCLMWKDQAKKFEDESGDISWILEYTNPCPRCHMPIEKDGTDNLMRCMCGQLFCWICGQTPDNDKEEWTSLSRHNCVENAGYKYIDVQLAKKEPWRYMHYYNHYKAYDGLLEMEFILSETIQQNVSKLQRRDFREEILSEHLKNCSWVTEALFRLFRSRRFLAYAYVFAYYTFGDRFITDEFNEENMESKQKLFDNQLKILEENVQRLSMLVESPFHWYSKVVIRELKVDVIALSNIVDYHYKKLYECINNYDVFDPTPQSDFYLAPEM